MDDRAASMLTLFRETHDRFRQLIGGLDSHTLTYVPAPEANSISTLVRHTLISEASMLGRLAGRPIERDYSRDFVNPPTTDAELLRQLDDADRRLEELRPLIGREALEARWPRPVDRLITGEEWLVHHYGHAREHIAHAELTLQLLEARRTPHPDPSA